MQKTKLAKAVAFALSGAALSVVGISNASAGSTGYNAFNHGAAPNAIIGGNGGTAPGDAGTDGWLVTTGQDPDPFGLTPGSTYTTDGHSYGIGPDAGNNLAVGGARVPWVGLNPYTTFGFAPAANKQYHTMNWAAELTGLGDSATISRIDSNTRYGGTVLNDGTTFNYADIDTAKGAWHDNVSTGWKHDTDIGLFRSSVTQLVTLNVASQLGTGEVDVTPDYGISVFTGMTAGANGGYSHHGGWHAVSNAVALGAAGDGINELAGTDISPNNPFGGSGEVRLVDDVLNNDLTFLANAGQMYTIYLGGFQGGDWTTTRNNYQLSFSTPPAAVPVPGAVWLFGSAIAGFLGLRRNKKFAA